MSQYHFYKGFISSLILFDHSRLYAHINVSTQCISAARARCFLTLIYQSSWWIRSGQHQQSLFPFSSSMIMLPSSKDSHGGRLIESATKQAVLLLHGNIKSTLWAHTRGISRGLPFEERKYTYLIGYLNTWTSCSSLFPSVGSRQLEY